MWERLAKTRLARLRQQFPAVLILGARQVGKTTLAREACPELSYLDLEDPRTRDLLSSDPAFQLRERDQNGLILDEAQVVPAIFPVLRGIIDELRSRTGRFVLLGSASPGLIREVSESLAGRVGILELDPLVAWEASFGTPALTWKEVWLRGGFPDALRGAGFREWWEAYLRTYVERDLPFYHLSVEPLVLRRLLTMLAHRQGCLLNASELGASLAVSYKTVQRYLDILEQTYLVRRLLPYSRNVGKRLVHAPKIYLRDTGLLHHLLNIDTLEQLRDHPGLGASWETFVLEDLLRREKLSHPFSQAYFWRTSAGAEADLVLERGSDRLVIEIKCGRGSKPATVRTLQGVMADLDSKQGWILDQDRGREPVTAAVTRLGYPEALEWLP